MQHLLILLVTLLAFSSCSKTSEDTPDTETPQCQDGGFFVDASHGDDTNDGTSSCTPWKSLHKVQTSTFDNNTSIFLKRGETWHEGIAIPASNITISAYGTGEDPLLDGAFTVSNWQDEGSFVYSHKTDISENEGLGNLSMDGNMMHFVTWNTNIITTFSSAANDSYSYDYTTKTLYIKITSDPENHSFQASKIYTAIKAENLSNITISNIEIRQFSLHGISFQNCTNCNVDKVTITQVGGAIIAPSLYAGNGIEYGNSSSNGTVCNVIISEIFDSCLSPQTYVSNQVLSHIAFKDSNLSKCGFAGIEISVLDNGGTTGSSIDGIDIENVKISDTGKGWSGARYTTEGYGIKIKADDTAGTITSTSITRSEISGAVQDGIYIYGETGVTTITRSSIHNNKAYGISLSALVTQTTPKLIIHSSLIYKNKSYGVYYNASNAGGFDLYQNTFYDNHLINLALFAYPNKTFIKNNIFFSSSTMTHIYATSTLASGAIDHNCYNNVTNMFGYNAAAYSRVSDFTTDTGFEADGYGGSQTDIIHDPDNKDFTLTASSGCIGLGDSSVNVTKDYTGSNFAVPPSSGAYEH